VSDDGLTWTFKLRKGIKFHDGYPFNARAVYDSFARVVFKQHPYNGYGKWQYLSLALGMVKDIQVIDDYTIALVTEKPYAPLLSNLALWLCPILSPKAMADYKDKIGTHPVGRSFKFKSWTKDDQIVLERNNEYWGEKAKVDRIVLKSIPEPSARLMALQSGTVDIADDLDPDSIAWSKAEDRDHRAAERERGLPRVQHQKPRLKDPKVRQALSHAIDRDTLIKSIFAGLAIPAKNPFPPSIWSYNDTIKPYEYNPDKAKKMLAEAKFDFNTEIELWAMPVSGLHTRPGEDSRADQACSLGGCESQDRAPRMGCLLEQGRQRRARHVHAGLARRQLRPGQLSLRAAFSRHGQGARRRQHRVLEESGVHGPLPEGPEDLQQGRPHEDLSQSAGDLPRGGALGAAGAHH
jgi:ABC-type transport system substrate-binding protein